LNLERTPGVLADLLPLERQTATRLRNDGRIHDEVLRKIEDETSQRNAHGIE
jgi:hypothetical protein